MVPHKVSCFVWKTIQNRIPSRVNLGRRGILFNEDGLFVGYNKVEESMDHLFLNARCLQRSGLFVISG